MYHEQHSSSTERSDPTDWSALIRLAIVVSIAAALMAVALAGYVPDEAIVVAVIVAGTMASWYQLEHSAAPRGHVHPVRIRRH